MTNQQAPEALRLAESLERRTTSWTEKSFAAAELRHLQAENERLAALVEAQQPAAHVQNPGEIEHVAGDVSKNGPESNMAQQPAPSAAAATEVENLRKALQFYADKDHFNIADEGAWDTVSGEPQNYWCDEEGTATVEDGTIARLALAGHPIKFDADASPQPSPTPQADSQPAPVPTSATGGDWTQPTTVALRLGDAMQLLCGGKRPPDDMVQQWLDNTSEALQEFAASNGPAWAQGIGLIDAAMVMVDQPTEIRTIDNPDRDHEHRAARAPADSVTAPAGWKLVPIEPTDAMWNAMMDWGTKKSEWLAILAAAPTPPAQAAESVLEDADPLQGAANWLAEAHGQFCVAVLQGCLMIGYNRAKRLHDAAIAARKQGGAT